MKRDLYTDRAVRIAVLAALLLFILGIAGLLCSCRTCKPVKEVYVERTDTLMRTRTDTLRILTERVDSVEVRDSVFMLVKGDTVFVKEYHFRDRTKMNATDSYKSKSDTCWRDRAIIEHRTRTIKERMPLRWWEKLLMWSGVAGLAAMTVGLVVWRRRKLRKS